MKIAMIYGQMSSTGRGPYDLDGLYTKVGLTGSESSFFNLARTLGERGHEVVVFCDCAGDGKVLEPSGVVVVPMAGLRGLPQLPVAAVIAWNEPDYLRLAPPHALRVLDQQLNDFAYCKPDWQDHVDVLVSPSMNHLGFLRRECGADPERVPRACFIPNSVDLDLLPDNPPVRVPGRVVYCSSPDRGLHHLLSLWPLVRRQVPGAELRVFYRLRPWIEQVQGVDTESGRRARYIDELLPRLASAGVIEVGPVSNAQMFHELCEAQVLAYPCDPVRYTEGFGVSVLDATAAGCLPIISDADALPSVHRGAARVIPGKPGDVRGKWADAIADGLTMATPPDIVGAMLEHAKKHSRQRIADVWESLLGGNARWH